MTAIRPDKPAAYYGRPRREMIAQVPATARRVLDVGCGAGAFGAGLKSAWRERGESLEIWGLEMDPEAGTRAAAVLDRVLIGDAAALAADLPAGHFDAVVFNDVLEHVLDPGALLAAMAPLLVAGGCAVASIPNVRHFPHLWDVVVRGRWDYTDEGILDRTHLRFFTRASMERLFAEAGFAVESVMGINPTGSAKFKLVNLLTLGRWADMRYLQFAIRARREGP
ncbi:methyltransferase domain-containing protein [bacterium]|nr:methyltransferase domain-containing protein [bacterium]